MNQKNESLSGTQAEERRPTESTIIEIDKRRLDLDVDKCDEPKLSNSIIEFDKPEEKPKTAQKED